MASNVLVSRLRRVYWPDFMVEYTSADVMECAPIAEYRNDGSDRDEDEYDIGRVRYFYEVLMAGGTIEPIEIDSESTCSRGGPITWLGPTIIDGHHRFAAVVLARRRTIQAHLSGLVTTHRWLTGLRKTPPPEVLESLR